MAIRTREKNGLIEYKARYYFYKEGKKKDSDTGWFKTEKEAIQEAERLKKIKDKEKLYNIASRRDKHLNTVYNEFVLYGKFIC